MSADDFVARMQRAAQHNQIELGVQAAHRRYRTRGTLRQVAGGAAAVALTFAGIGVVTVAAKAAEPHVERAGQALCANISQAFQQLAMRSMPQR